MNLLRYLVCLHNSLCTIEGLLGELLDICLPCSIIDNCVFGLIFGFGLLSGMLAKESKGPGSRQPVDLLQLVHQVDSVFHHIFIRLMELPCKNLVNDPVFACKCQHVPFDMSGGRTDTNKRR